MAYKEGKDFNDSYEGSTGSDGEGRTSYNSTDSGDYISRKSSRKGRDRDHIHYYNNDSSNTEHYKPQYEDGQRLASVSKERTASDGSKYGAKVNKGSEGDLFDSFCKFLGF
jgi:hypothetical protein